MKLVHEVIDPEIADFNTWFSEPERGNGAISGFEKEILRSFLWWLIVEKGTTDGS